MPVDERTGYFRSMERSLREQGHSRREAKVLVAEAKQTARELDAACTRLLSKMMRDDAGCATLPAAPGKFSA